MFEDFHYLCRRHSDISPKEQACILFQGNEGVRLSQYTSNAKKIKMRKSIIITMLLAISTAAHAQRHIITYDPELNEPVKDVLVWADHQKAYSTSLIGEVRIPDRFDTLHINKPGYVSLSIPASVVADSIPLIQDYKNIGEVVVQGVYQNKQLAENVKRWTKEAKKEFALRHPITGYSFSLADCIDPRLRRIKKQTKKLEKIFKRMDAEGNDPIIQAYRKAINQADH